MSIQTLSVLDHIWHIIANPHACEEKSMNQWDMLSSRFGAAGVRFVLHEADAEATCRENARRLCAEGCRHLMVIGGDGTVNEVVNGIMESGADVRDLCLAVMPLGRGNDWARTHNYPKKIDKCVEMFLRGRFMRHDIGKVQTLRENAPVATRYFVNIAGFGFDAEVIYDTVYNKPHFMGISVYILSLLHTLFHYKSTPVEIVSPDIAYQGETFLMVAGLCQYNGGGIRQAPEAQPDSGRFHVVVIPKVSKAKVFSLMPYMFSGRHIEKSNGLVKSFRTNQLTLKVAELYRGEVEGELLETGDYQITLLPGAFQMLTNREN